MDHHNWIRKKVRFCVQRIGDVSVLYYREKKTGDSKRHSLRVVAVEDLWETLMGVHEQVCHGGRTRMEKYLVEHGSHVPRPVIHLFPRSLCQATRGRKRTHKIVHKPIIPDDVGQRGQANLVDLQMVPDNDYKFILNYQDCLSKYFILRPLRDVKKECSQWVSELPHV